MRQNLGASSLTGVEHRPRKLHGDRKQHEHDEVGQHDHREHGVAQPSPGARIRHNRRGHRGREGHDDDDEHDEHGEPLEADRVGSDREPWPCNPSHDEHTNDRNDQRHDRHACDDSQTRPQALDAECQARDERDERRRDPGDDLQLCGHRLGNEIAKVGSDEDAEEEIPRQTRESEASQDIAQDRGAHQRESKGQRCGGGTGGRVHAEAAHPDHRPNGQDERQDAPHSSTLRGGSRNATSSDPIVPTTTAVSSTEASVPTIATAFSAKATPNAPGRRR